MSECIATTRKGNADMKNQQQDMQEVYESERDKQEVFTDYTTVEEAEHLVKNIFDHER